MEEHIALVFNDVPYDVHAGRLFMLCKLDDVKKEEAKRGTLKVTCKVSVTVFKLFVEFINSMCPVMIVRETIRDWQAIDQEFKCPMISDKLAIVKELDALRTSVKRNEKAIGFLEQSTIRYKRESEAALEALSRKNENLLREVQESKRSLRNALVVIEKLDRYAMAMELGNYPMTTVTEFPYQDNPFKGILDGLAVKYGMDSPVELIDRGIIDITVKGKKNGDFLPKQVLDYHTQSTAYRSVDSDTPNMWLAIDFLANRITLDHYTLRVWSGSYITSWVCEVSVDGQLWDVVDSHTNCQDLCGMFKTETYKVDPPVECKCIRIRQTDRNHDGNDTLVLSGLEVFGVLETYE